MQLLLEFDDFPEEKIIIGMLLMAYAEFEVNMAKLVGYAMGGKDMDRGVRILFRVHGEGPRLDVVDAIVRPFFDGMKLAGQWSNTLGALRYCKDIRNQYAHCHWFSDEGKPLTFINLDNDADRPEGELQLQLHPTDVVLLRKQCVYFEYANAWLYFLDCRCQLARREESPDPPVPKSIPQPPKHNRSKKHPA